MDIHAPEGPTHSFKDFLIHIGIVTIGILIALGLEGVRETIHERHQIAETREIFRDELVENKKQLAQQRQALKDTIAQLDSTLANLDELNAKPSALAVAIDKLTPGFYFFTTASWETALSTGVLDHMAPAEVHSFANATISVRDYVTIQDQAISHYYELEALFHSRPTLSPQKLDEGREKIQLFRFYCGSMNHLLDELSTSIDASLAQR
jgi:cell division protein FtsB